MLHGCIRVGLLFLILLRVVVAHPFVMLFERVLVGLSGTGHGFCLGTLPQSDVFDLFDIDGFAEHGEVGLSRFVEVSHGPGL